MGAISFSIDERLLAFFTKELPLEVFVETGTFKGDSVNVARRFFRQCHTVEMSPALHEQAQKRFAGKDNIQLHLSDSPGFLRKHQSEFSARPALFWLDAHWCVADDTSGESSQSPLLAELHAIGQLHRDSVLLIDDARLYLCSPPRPHRISDWPDIDDVCRVLFALSPGHRLIIYNDVFVFYPAAIQNAMRQFSHETGENWLMLARAARSEWNGPTEKPSRKRKFLRRLFKK